MALPLTLSAAPQGNTLNGIIYKIKNTYKIEDPIASKVVVPSSIGDSTHPTYSDPLKAHVLWNTTYGSKRTKDSWVQLSFPGRTVYPVAYSFREPLSGGWCYAKAWDVYGIKEEDENKTKESWNLLGSNKTSE